MPTLSFSDESNRLAALNALALLDSEPEKEFDALVALAAELLGCGVAMLNLVGPDRLWVKASTIEQPRSHHRDDGTFCSHTIRSREPMVVEDLSADPRFRHTPAVAQAGLRFYAGTALHVTDEHGVRQPIGTLCVVDNAPRIIGTAAVATLRRLACLAEALLEARRTALKAIHIATTGERLVSQLARQDRIFRQAERIAAIGSWRLSLGDSTLQWSDNVYRIHGLVPGHQPMLQTALDFYPAHVRDEVSRIVEGAIAHGTSFDFETDFITADGRARRVRSMGEAESDDGVVTALVGVFQDITDRHALEKQLRRSADTDALTGIANRAAFDRELEHAMVHARDTGATLLLALIDLDGFKAINDTLGHQAGDDVLRMTGAALREPWLANCFAARIGGDEFALVIQDPALIAGDRDDLRRRIEEVLRVAVEANGVTMASAGSVGIAAFDRDCHSLRDFARRADTILYAAKRDRVGTRGTGTALRAA